MRIVHAARESVKRALPAGPKVRRLPFGVGRGILLETDFHGGDIQLFLGLYEVELSRHLRKLAYRGARSFDIGGHVGYDALVLASLTGGPVVTVECDRDYVSTIRANVARNPTLGPITVEEAVVSSASSGVDVTIDDLADRYFTPDLVKLDIEGAEAAALRGASRVLASRRPGLLIEVHGEQAEWDCLELLKRAGYPPPTVIEPRRWLPEHRPLAHNRWLVLSGAPAGGADPPGR